MRIKDTTKAYTDATLQLPSKEEGVRADNNVQVFTLCEVSSQPFNRHKHKLFRNQEKLKLVNQLVNQFKGCKCVEI